MTQTRTPTRRRWLRFSLRTFLIATTVLIVTLGSWIRSAQRQRQAVERLRQYPGVWVDYDHQPSAPRNFNDPFYKSTHSWAPVFLYNAMGVDYFHNAVGVWLNPLAEKRFEALKACKDLTHLRRLELYHFNEEDRPELLDIVCELHTIEELTIHVRPEWLTRERVGRLAQLRHLKKLTLSVIQPWSGENHPVTLPQRPFDLSVLAELNQLEELGLGFSNNAQWQLSNHFLENHSRLKKLTITGSVLLGDYIAAHFDRLVAEAPNLEFLQMTIGNQTSSFAPLKKLTKLTAISLSGFSYGDAYDQRVIGIKQEVPHINVVDTSWAVRWKYER
jgi:hypothetical protein